MDNKTPQQISRRDALKILAGVASATALATIPDKWTKPGMEVGVLPAHAQTSVPTHTLVVGVSDPAANFCFSLISTVTIAPPASGILMRYTITTSGPAITSPAALTGTVPTDGTVVASLSVDVDQTSFGVGDTVTVTWSFENASDGVGSGSQVFTSVGGGC